MFKLKSLLFLLISSVMIVQVSCVTNQNATLIETKSATVDVTSTPDEIDSVTPTIIKEAIQTITPAIEITHTPIPQQDNCVGLNEAKITDEGYLFATNSERIEGENDYISINMETLEVRESLEPLPFLGISPNQNAVIAHANEKYILIDKDKPEPINLARGNNISYLEWIDNQTLITGEVDFYGLVTNAIIENPYLGESNEIDLSFPNLFGIDLGVRLLWGDVPKFDASGKYVLIPDGAVKLVDFESKLVLQEIASSPHRYVAKWNPIGGSFVVPGQIDYSNELVMVSVDTLDLTVLTEFSKTYRDFWIDEISWSPDSKWIVFWLAKEGYSEIVEEQKKSFVILDLENNSITETCITSLEKVDFDSVENFVWSQDSDRVVINVYSSPDENSILIVDIANLEFQTLVENTKMVPYGWLSFEPKIP